MSSFPMKENFSGGRNNQMKLARLIMVSGMLLLIFSYVGSAQTVVETRTIVTGTAVVAKRSTLAVRYRVDNDTNVDMAPTGVGKPAWGAANVKHKAGRSRIELEMTKLGNPQRLGAYYTTFVLWAIAPEGQAERLAQLPVKSKVDVVATTSFQTFGLIITAEPHGMVSLPSPIIVAENVLRKGTKGGVETSQIEYRGDTGALYLVSASDSPPLVADYETPLSVLGARRAVEIARHCGAERFAEAELKDAEVKLAALEQLWPSQRNHEAKYLGMANDVMRLGEHARVKTEERLQQARLAAERRTAGRMIAQAQSEADSAREAMQRAESEADLARQKVAQAQTEAERAKANEELARIEAEGARLQAEQAKQERDQAQQRLYVSLSEILETRREARGLIVNLSDVLFDFNKASLKPGAREKLSKLAGILLAYPGGYRIEIEGHTDAIGSEEYNLKLSQARAESVCEYLKQSSIAADRIIAVRGFGKSKPVASNDSDQGRQVNRRVEIIIADAELSRLQSER
jgi:outer membrane protein OmpA-like peptidoglycan-associated protein